MSFRRKQHAKAQSPFSPSCAGTSECSLGEGGIFSKQHCDLLTCCSLRETHCVKSMTTIHTIEIPQSTGSVLTEEHKTSACNVSWC